MFSFSIGSRFKVQRFGGSHAHFDVTRPAKCPACDGDGNAKQGHKGNGKE
jgi:DnaJ-class molecular chaperone